jgi:hypothetical protein
MLRVPLFRAVLIGVLAASAIVAMAQPQAKSLGPGSAARKAVMDALRPRVEKEIGPKVIFSVTEAKAIGSWAFVIATPKRPGGKAVDYSKTKFAKAAKAGQFEDRVVAILSKKAGKWSVYLFSFGATDDPVAGWMDKHPKVPWGSFGG